MPISTFTRASCISVSARHVAARKMKWRRWLKRSSRRQGFRPGHRGVYSLDLKADECAILDLAASLGLRLSVFDAPRLEQETPRLSQPSDIVFAEVGCHGVAEGAALAAAGPAATLILPKKRDAHATMAVAIDPTGAHVPQDCRIAAR